MRYMGYGFAVICALFLLAFAGYVTGENPVDMLNAAMSDAWQNVFNK